MRAVARAWDRFWFRPQPTSTLAVLRIAFGLLTTAWAIMLAPDIPPIALGAGLAAGGVGLIAYTQWTRATAQWRDSKLPILDWIWFIGLPMLAFVLIVVLIRVGFEYAWRTRFQTISGLESFSVSWAYLAVPVGASFCVLGIIGCLLDPRRQELETAQ